MQNNQNNKKKSRKGIINLVIILATAGVMVWLISRMNDPQTVLKAIREADLRYVAAALGCMVAFWIIEALILKSVTRGMGQHIGYWPSQRISMIGQLFNNITPFASGGQPIQIVEMAHYGISYGSGSCIMMVKFIVYQIAMTLYGLITAIRRAPFFSQNVPGFYLFIILGFLTNFVALAVTVLVGLFPNGTRKGLHRLIDLGARIKIVRHPDKLHARLTGELDSFYNNFQLIKRSPSRLAAPLLLTLGQLTIYFIIPFLLFRAVGINDIAFDDLFSATVFVIMVTSFIPAPGASGGAEGSFYWFLSIFMDNSDLLLMLTVLWRILIFYLPIFVGAAFYFTRSIGRPHDDAAAGRDGLDEHGSMEG